MSDTPWMNVRETADHLKVSERHVHRLTKDEGLPVNHAGGRILYHKEKVDEWLADRKK